MLHLSRVLWRVAVAVAVVGVTVLGVGTPASAHVTVSSASAVQGGYAKVTFRVPNEKSTAGTAKVEVFLPTDQPIASVSIKPVAGWTVATENAKLPTPIKTDDGELTEAVSKITWTAAGDAVIQAGQFQEFDLSLGPLPKVDQLVFKALQTYTDGDVVRWIEVPSGNAEPEHPAPVLKLAKAGEATDAPGAAADGDDPDTAGAGSDTAATEDSDALPLGLDITGAVLGALGLGLALAAYRKAGTRP
jgi:periplasmic copper chaperone A